MLWALLALALILSLASDNGVQRYILWLIAVSILFDVYQRQRRHNDDVVPVGGNPTIEDEFPTLVTRPIQAFGTIPNVALHTHVFGLNARPRNFPCRRRACHSDVMQSNPENPEESTSDSQEMVRHQHNMLSLADSDRNLEDYPREYIWEPGEVPGRNRSGPVTTRRWAVVRIIQQLLLCQRSNDRMTMEEFRLLPYDVRCEIAGFTLEQLKMDRK